MALVTGNLLKSAQDLVHIGNNYYNKDYHG